MRSAGILLHMTSLPSPGGLGDLGQEAYAFADFLRASGMKIWQVLPVGPTGYGESPYQSSSAFAGNPLLISLPLLREEGLLDFEDGELLTPADPAKADYDGVRKNRMALLRRAFRQSGPRLRDETEAFRRDNAWAGDFALFSAVKSHFGGEMWSRWPDRGILLMGDMPIYVAEDSADTWTHPEVFQLDRNRLPERVAGVPPDLFSEDGQLWGNPLYRWDALRKQGYAWWVDRMKSMTGLFDIVRVDHFIGFGHYYSIPYGAPNARSGRWEDGPGIPLFETLKREIPGMRIVAEDLGEVNDQVLELMAWTGFPGMKVLCYGFGGDPAANPHYPDNITPNTVYYTGTHDNDTVLSWVRTADPKELSAARKALGFRTPEEAPAAFVRGALASAADTVILPMQDILGLDGDARMNLPGTVGGNWLWRMLPGAASPAEAERLRGLLRETGRL